MTPALQALQRLRDGNGRFASDEHGRFLGLDPNRRQELTSGQTPFAAILSCADSRVPPEIVFDQGLGDLFIIRVAGNIITPVSAGSIELAAAELGTRLVVVLGHSSCSAVTTALRELTRPTLTLSHNFGRVIDHMRPALTGLPWPSEPAKQRETVRHGVRANVETAVTRLTQISPLLEHLMHEDDLLIVGAEYNLETGIVDFFHQVPANE